MTDNRTNEPNLNETKSGQAFCFSEDQVEAAAKAMHETGNPWCAAYGGWGAAGFEIKRAFRKSARAALVAAQGAAPVLPSNIVDEWVYRARISILNSGSHTSPEAARAALDRMIEDHVLELEPEPVFIEKRLRNAWVPVVEAIGGEGR